MNWYNFSNWYHEEFFVAAFPGGHELRLTIGVQSGSDEAMYRYYLAQAHEYIREQHRTTPREILRADKPEPAALSDWNRLYDRAYMLATVRKVEMRQGTGEWEETEFPADWVDPANFGKRWPGNVHEMWRALANSQNPGLYNGAVDDDAKNAVRVVAGPLTS